MGTLQHATNMNAEQFEQANITYGPPEGVSEAHVHSIPAFVGAIEGGPFDGSHYTVVAWRPDEKDLERLNNGGVVYLSVVGGLMPHFLCTSFEEAKQ